MEVKITRKGDSQWFKGVKSLTVMKRGLIPQVYANMEFREGASTEYTSKKHNISWRIDPNEHPGMGMAGCETIEVSEEVQSSQ